MTRNVSIEYQVLESMLNLAREMHPQEVVLLLRGKVNRCDIRIDEFLLPPFASAGRGFAQFPPRMLPIDFSVVGTAHSHPSGAVGLSAMDINHFYSRIMMIIAYPYTTERTVVYNAKGQRHPLIVLD